MDLIDECFHDLSKHIQHCSLIFVILYSSLLRIILLCFRFNFMVCKHQQLIAKSKIRFISFEFL